MTADQTDKAEITIDEAEKNLTADEAPLALAKCWELMAGKRGAANEKARSTWLANARRWYQKAQAARPADIAIAGRTTSFSYGQSGPGGRITFGRDLEAGRRRRSAQIKAWARRTKALILAASPDPQRVRSALAVLEPAGRAALADAGPKTFEDSDDLRALVHVLIKQKTDQDRERAINILKSLVSKDVCEIE